MIAPMKRSALALAAAALAGPALADPLDDALKAAGGTLCFTRSYDSAWIKAHRGQTIREVRFAVNKHNDWRTLRMSLQGSDKPIYIFGECQWYDGDLNRDGQGDPIEPSFKPTTGLGCMLYVDVTAGAAEEGGYFPVEWGGDGKYIQVHLPDRLAAWRSRDVADYATWTTIRPGNRVIRLNRAPASACRELTQFAPGQPL
jgi:hypothetical protein